MFIYKITNKVNNKAYVGQTIQIPEKRWRRHVLNCNNINIKETPLIRAMRKYGLENFIFEVIDEAIDLDSLNKKEIVYIEKLNSLTTENGYNVEFGGKNKIKTKEHKEKISKSLKGRKRKPFSKEWKENISKGNKGKKLSKEHKEKISKANSLRKGRGVTKISKSQREKMVNGLKNKCNKKIICIETGILYNSITEASNLLKIDKSNICRVLKGRTKSTGGFSFKYI